MFYFAKNFAMHGVYFFKKYTHPQFEKERILGEILRNTHSIEKGLSLANVRFGFGISKIEEAKRLIDEYLKLGGDVNSVQLKMFVCSLSAYLDYHKQNEYYNSDIEKVNDIYNELLLKVQLQDNNFGGVIRNNRITYSKEQLETIESLFKGRHSVREFDGSPINLSKLKTAILLAMRCPSACNRQCYRVHIVNKSAFARLNNWMDGIGGFADDIDKLIIITGNISVYRMTEPYQHVVTASVFASYLTLSLQAYGIGCCFIQRDVIPNKKWGKIANEFNIPLNEEIVCCLGIGNLKEEYTVPISYRLPYETIVNEIY